MKYLVLLLMVVSSAWAACGDSEIVGSGIKVSAYGKVVAVPDLAVIPFTIVKSAASTTLANKKLKKEFALLERSMKKLKIKGLEIKVYQTEYYLESGYSSTATNQEPTNKITGNIVLRNSQVDIDKVISSLIEDEIRIGATARRGGEQNILYALSKFDALENQAIELALKDAAQSAQSILSHTKKTIDTLQAITKVEMNNRRDRGYRTSDNHLSEFQYISKNPKKLNIEAEIDVRYGFK